jgi:hypothetical protein
VTVRDLMLVPEPSEETMADRRSRDYIAQFAERTSPTKAIRRKCLECMGANLANGQLPRGDAEAVRAVDECSVTHCPLWAPLRKEHLDGGQENFTCGDNGHDRGEEGGVIQLIAPLKLLLGSVGSNAPAPLGFPF